jgi:hypothetical protein
VRNRIECMPELREVAPSSVMTMFFAPKRFASLVLSWDVVKTVTSAPSCASQLDRQVSEAWRANTTAGGAVAPTGRSLQTGLGTAAGETRAPTISSHSMNATSPRITGKMTGESASTRCDDNNPVKLIAM